MLEVTQDNETSLCFNGYCYYYTRLMASFQDDLGKPVPGRYTSLDLNEARDDGFGYAMASAGPYANNVHLAPDR